MTARAWEEKDLNSAGEALVSQWKERALGAEASVERVRSLLDSAKYENDVFTVAKIRRALVGAPDPSPLVVPPSHPMAGTPGFITNKKLSQ